MNQSPRSEANDAGSNQDDDPQSKIRDFDLPRDGQVGRYLKPGQDQVPGRDDFNNSIGREGLRDLIDSIGSIATGQAAQRTET